MSDVRVLIHPADNGGCGLYRMRLPAKHIRQAKVEYDRSYQLLVQDRLGAQHVMDVLDPPDVDVLVWQRPLNRRAYETMQLFQSKGIAVVVELDDDFQAITKDHITYREASPLTSPESNWNWLKKSCSIADWVTVTTPSLAKHYAPHGRVTVLPNYVPDSYLKIKAKPHDEVRIGWSGSVKTHPGDLEVTQGAVGQVLNETESHLWVVGTGEGVRQRLDYQGPIRAAGWVNLNRYPKELAQFDVGIVPLIPSRFNASKSALKLIEMAAVGVPAVVSPTPDNLRMHKAGLGLIAENWSDWYTNVRRLATDTVYREELATQGRSVMADYTYEKQAWRWLEAWTSAANQRKSA